MGWIPGKAGVIEPGSGDIAVREAVSFTPGPAYSQNHDLLVAYTFRCFEAVNPDVTELRCENLTTFGDPVAGDDKHQNPTGFQPPVGMA